jgi:hypothetical protein
MVVVSKKGVLYATHVPLKQHKELEFMTQTLYKKGLIISPTRYQLVKWALNHITNGSKYLKRQLGKYE